MGMSHESRDFDAAVTGDAFVGIDNAAQIFQSVRRPRSFVSLSGADHSLTRASDADYAAGIIAAWSARYVSGDD